MSARGGPWPKQTGAGSNAAIRRAERRFSAGSGEKRCGGSRSAVTEPTQICRLRGPGGGQAKGIRPPCSGPVDLRGFSVDRIRTTGIASRDARGPNPHRRPTPHREASRRPIRSDHPHASAGPSPHRPALPARVGPHRPRRERPGGRRPRGPGVLRGEDPAGPGRAVLPVPLGRGRRSPRGACGSTPARASGAGATPGRPSCRATPRRACCSRRSRGPATSRRCRPRRKLPGGRRRRLPPLGRRWARPTRAATRPAERPRPTASTGGRSGRSPRPPVARRRRPGPDPDRRLHRWPGCAAKGLDPAPEADRRTLIRRLSFDLTGLPPTPEEVDAFVADDRPDAYERLVDRLLASPHYGERWARHWMDLVHFAETHGHDQDRIRPNAWPYRDYLIESFNGDTPYARFVQEQVAADVLFPDEPAADRRRSGFLAAGPWDESSLRDIREDSIDRQIGHYLDRDDMVTTVMSTFVSTHGPLRPLPRPQVRPDPAGRVLRPPGRLRRASTGPTAPTTPTRTSHRLRRDADRAAQGRSQRRDPALMASLLDAGDPGRGRRLGGRRSRPRRPPGRCSTPTRLESAGGADARRAARPLGPRRRHPAGRGHLHDHRHDRPAPGSPPSGSKCCPTTACRSRGPGPERQRQPAPDRVPGRSPRSTPSRPVADQAGRRPTSTRPAGAIAGGDRRQRPDRLGHLPRGRQAAPGRLRAGATTSAATAARR